MAIGFVLMFIYAVFVLGRSNRVEYRMYLAAAGLVSVLLGLLMSFGIIMAVGIKFNTLLGVLPFLAMGNSLVLPYPGSGKKKHVWHIFACCSTDFTPQKPLNQL